MADTESYNGWTNYETWAMALWIDNDQGSYEYARELIEDCSDGYGAGQVLRDWIEDLNPLDEMPASVFTDLLASALGEVDWTEIARNYLAERVDA